MDCAKHGIADQIVDVIVRKLKNEPSFHRRVDYWFLLDSFTEVTHTQKVAAYLPIVQTSLPRILNATAPPGGVARENRKQCLKVLNLRFEKEGEPSRLSPVDIYVSTVDQERLCLQPEEAHLREGGVGFGCTTVGPHGPKPRRSEMHRQIVLAR